jgi:hypothetical protein
MSTVRVGWLTEQIRVTLFPVHGRTVATNSWEGIVGTPPNQINREPALAVSQESGPFREGRLSLINQPDRSILVFSAEPFGPTPTTEVLNLGEPEAAMTRFTPAIKKLLNSETVSSRVGVGVALISPVSSVSEGLRLVFNGLQMGRDTSDVLDFLFQINVPIPSTTLGGSVRLNRLAKWQVFSLQLITMMIGPEGGQVANSFAQPVIRLELDINTPPNYSETCDAAKIGAVVDECLEAALTLVKEGGLSI